MKPLTRFELWLYRVETRIKELLCDDHDYNFPYPVSEMNTDEYYAISVSCSKCGKREIIHFNKHKLHPNV